MGGFGGHVLTKSGRYSITFRGLRDNRITWRRTESVDVAEEQDEESTLVIATPANAGSGSRTLGDTLLRTPRPRWHASDTGEDGGTWTQLIAHRPARKHQRQPTRTCQTPRPSTTKRKSTLDTATLLEQLADGTVIALVPNPRPVEQPGQDPRIFGKRWYSMKEVHDKRIKLHTRAKAGPMATKVPTVGEYVAGWLADVVKSNLAPLTYATYETFVRLYIVPRLGTKRLDRLQVRDVQIWLNKIRQTCQCCAQGKDAARQWGNGGTARLASVAPAPRRQGR
jgi:hypothetical protein